MIGKKDPSRRRRIAARLRGLSAKLALLAASLAVAFVIAELGARLVLPAPPGSGMRGFYSADPELDYVITPGASGFIRDPEFEVQVRANALGLRGQDLGPKQPSQRRILVLGDSFTFGQEVDENRAYPSQVEMLLHRRGLTDYQIINAGVPGYGTYQAAGWFEQIADRLAPDGVLLGFYVGNDFDDNLGLTSHTVIDGYLITRDEYGSRARLATRLGLSVETRLALSLHVRLYSLATNAWHKLLFMTGMSTSGEMFEIYRIRRSDTVETMIAATRDALVRIAAACTQRGIPLAIVVIPDLRVTDDVSGLSGYRLERPGEIIRSIAAEQQIPFLDLTWMHTVPEPLIFPLNGHWNEEGHAVAARAIADAMVTGELAPLLTN